MNKLLTIIFSALIVLSLLLGAGAFFGLFQPKGEPGLTIVTAPDQTKAQRPPCFPDPEANYIPMPEGENLALGKSVVSGVHNDVYVIENVNDGKTDTYWESKGFPAEVTVDLGESRRLTAVAVRLNPSAIWEPRTQEIAVALSADGTSYSEVSAAVKYDFDPATGNRIRIDFPAAEGRFVKLTFTLNTSSRTGGAQAAEIEIYE